MPGEHKSAHCTSGDPGFLDIKSSRVDLSQKSCGSVCVAVAVIFRFLANDDVAVFFRILANDDVAVFFRFLANDVLAK